MIKNFLTIQIEYLVNDKDIIPFKQLCYTINHKIELESKCIFNQFSCIKLDKTIWKITCIQGFSSTDGYFYHIYNVKEEYKKLNTLGEMIFKRFYGLKRHLKYIKEKYTEFEFLEKSELDESEVSNYSYFDII